MAEKPRFQYTIGVSSDFTPLKQQLKDAEVDISKLGKAERDEIQRVVKAKIKAIMRKGEAMGEFEYPELEAEMQPILEEWMARVNQAVQNLAVNQCYGSYKLVNAMQNL